jgi:hypothetical protein
MAVMAQLYYIIQLKLILDVLKETLKTACFCILNMAISSLHVTAHTVRAI